MRYGHRNEEGEIIETNSVALALWPQEYKHGWFCSQCNIYMQLYPISLDLPVTHWSCKNCKKNITMSERDESFNAHVKIAKERYDLKTLEYNKENRTWKIESALFIGDNRIGAKRKVIKQTEHDEIIDKLQEVISKELHISFENWSEFWATE